MDIKIIYVGKTKSDYWNDAQDEYLKRLGPYAKIEMVEVVAERLDGSVSDEVAMRREGEKLLSRIPDRAEVFSLDKSGKQFPSDIFARKLEEIAGNGTTIAFVIGGAAGLHGDVLKRAQRKLSLSEMTLPHELARVVLLEQIYRATQIIKGGKYHR